MSEDEQIQLKHGSIDTARCSTGYTYGSAFLVVLFEHSTSSISSDELHYAITKNTSFTLRNNTMHVDAMSIKRQKCFGYHVGLSIIAEVHFNLIKSPYELQEYLMYLKNSSSENRCISLAFKTIRSPVHAKVISAIPPRPVYFVYKLSNAPLGGPYQVLKDLGEAVQRGLCRHDEMPENQASVIPAKLDLIQCFLHHQSDKAGDNPTYDGKVAILVHAIQGEPLAVIPFCFQNQKYELKNGTEHYLYCATCKMLDYHETGDFNCPSTNL